SRDSVSSASIEFHQLRHNGSASCLAGDLWWGGRAPEHQPSERRVRDASRRLGICSHTLCFLRYASNDTNASTVD
ncbi:hypothetical protein JMJ77_0004091, partial [Colletotrichum scovillei]